MQVSPMSITIRTLTWSRESHGLFDYESHSIHKNTLKASGASKIIRNCNEVQLIPQNAETDSPDSLILAFLDEAPDSYYLRPHEPENLWLVVKSLRENHQSGFELSEGTIIKLGRVKYRVRELCHEEKQLDNFQMAEEAAEPGRACKICLWEENTSENPLISPCSCSGSMKYMHLDCLKTWLESRKSTRSTENSMSFFWKSIDCEICKEPFPITLPYKGKPYELFSVEERSTPYIVLEAVTRERNNNRGIHFITLKNRFCVKLGRGHDSDVRISDISVSRCHAMIEFKDGRFYLQDNNSKFGTLVQIQGEFQIKEETGVISLQSGRTVLSIFAKNNFLNSESMNISIEETEDESFTETL